MFAVMAQLLQQHQNYPIVSLINMNNNDTNFHTIEGVISAYKYVLKCIVFINLLISRH